MKNFVLVSILWMTALRSLGAESPTKISVIGAVRSPKPVVTEMPISLAQVLSSCDDILIENWMRAIIISKQESAILTTSRKYELRSVYGEELEKALKEIVVYPGEVVFVQERFD